MRQNGHGAEFTGRYDQTAADYARQPTKPVLDGEPIYEDHPVSFDANEARPLDRRRRPARRCTGICSRARSATPTATTPSGRCGRRTRADQQPAHAVDRGDQPAGRAADAASRRALLESRPFLTRVPDDDVIVPGRVRDQHAGRRPLSVRGHARRVRQPMRWSTRPSAVHSPSAWVPISGPTARAWWFNPRTGEATDHRRRSPLPASASSSRLIQARCSTGSWCSTTRYGISGRLGSSRARCAIRDPRCADPRCAVRDPGAPSFPATSYPASRIAFTRKSGKPNRGDVQL